jgi:hypothetical protein
MSWKKSIEFLNNKKIIFALATTFRMKRRSKYNEREKRRDNTLKAINELFKITILWH